MKLAALVAVAVLAAALLVAGCGSGSGSGSNSTAPAGSAPSTSRGSGKKTVAPNAPAGSKVVACPEGRGETGRLRATAIDCRTARTTMRQWERSHACALGRDASRDSCSLGGFRCQAVKVDRGAAVSCARADGDVSFIARSRSLRKSGSG
jgi:hypothetical protein